MVMIWLGDFDAVRDFSENESAKFGWSSYIRNNASKRSSLGSANGFSEREPEMILRFNWDIILEFEHSFNSYNAWSRANK